MYNITDRQFKYFIKECKKWIEFFGLKDWECFYECKEDENNRASLHTYSEAGICTFILSNEWNGKPTNYLLRKSAFHETVELLLMRMRQLTYNRFSTQNEIDTENHRIIRTLENVLFDAQDKGKETEEQKGIVETKIKKNRV